MQAGKLLFKTSLADRVYKPWYDKTSNWVLLVVWAISWAFTQSFDNIWIELMPWIAMWIWMIYYYYIYRYNQAGTLEFYERLIRIRSEELTKDFEISNIAGLTIQRGSNFHSADIGEKPRMENNYLRFNYEGWSYEFLFLIGSHSQNKAFESMVVELRDRNIPVIYSSI